MLCEGVLRLLWRERLEVKVQPGSVPVTPEVIDGLRTHHRTDGIPLRRQPRAEFAFRPEGRDVGSCEPYVIPEQLRRHEEVDDRITYYAAVFDVEADGLPCLWRVRRKSSVADETENRKPVPNTVRVPGAATRVHYEVRLRSLRMDAPSRSRPRLAARRDDAELRVSEDRRSRLLATISSESETAHPRSEPRLSRAGRS